MCRNKEPSCFARRDQIVGLPVTIAQTRAGPYPIQKYVPFADALANEKKDGMLWFPEMPGPTEGAGQHWHSSPKFTPRGHACR
jgi:hypothetical protein